jgi:lipid-A-disaccharide synthase
MVNLIAGREVVPELVQGDFTVENVVRRVREILSDGPARDKMLKGLAEVKDRLCGSGLGSTNPADRAAATILGMLARGPSQSIQFPNFA